MHRERERKRETERQRERKRRRKLEGTGRRILVPSIHLFLDNGAATNKQTRTIGAEGLEPVNKTNFLAQWYCSPDIRLKST